MLRIAGEFGAYESMPIVWIRPLAHGTDDRRPIAFACPGNKLHARTVTQKLQLAEGSLQLAMAIGEWLVMPSEVYEFSKKFIALLKARLVGHAVSAGQTCPVLAEPSCPVPAPPPSGFMLVSGGAQLQMETDSDDDGDELRGQAQAGGGPLPSRAEDLLNWHMHGGSAPDLPPTASIGNREGYVPLYD